MVATTPNQLASQIAVRPLRIATAFRQLPDPVLIIGMHRSGTSLVAGMLHIMGVYMDPQLGEPGKLLTTPTDQQRRDGYAEAIAFRLLNEAVMRQADGATWENILPFLQRRDHVGFARYNLARMQYATFSSLRNGYLQPLSPAYRGAWGWKDPRNSLTLPYWLRLFPQARLLHVRRNPEAIARSLMRRAEAAEAVPGETPSLLTRLHHKVRDPMALGRHVGRRLSLIAPPVSGFSMRDRADCLALTELYVEECLRWRNRGDRYMEVYFEDLIRDPAEWVSTLAEFAGVCPSREQQQCAVDFVQYK